MQVTISLEAEQIINAAGKMSIDDKILLFEKIKDDIFKYKFESLLNKFKTFKISEDEITREVEHVRSERYKNRH